ncbi:uncharacterized protein LOC126552316 [Aphis gossypii]|uniref:uncharacterized protein LOC126552316 n=1 Tax=Aphis gossypii TaxID=80765 RepID=UPI0021595BC6|nr:uncharacterized protein LOC126552316 [Aphis gossypii]
MGKPQYIQKFRMEWLKDKAFADWLKKVPEDDSKAFCKSCLCSIRARRPDLVTHAATKKHKSATNAIQTHANRIKVVTPCTKTAQTEASLSLFISAHCSVLSIDHLGELCKEKFPGSKQAENLSLHRTKYESTDISVTKYLGIAIMYFSTQKSTIVTTFFGLEKLVECNAQAIVESVEKSLETYQIDIKNLIGIGTDNASVMVGINNGVHALLKKYNPNLILIRCVCHSIQLATSFACSQTLPRHLDFMISETYNWFSKSSLRQQSYLDLFKTMNDGHAPLKIVRACSTRWLSIESAVSRIIDQWLELKLHFQLARSNEKCFTAEVLYDMYCNEQNLAFFLFLRPALANVQSVNKLFESNNVDQTKLAIDLSTLVVSLGKLIVLPSFNFDPVTNENFINHLHPKPFLGYSFENKVTELKNNGSLNANGEQVLRDRCIKFTTILIQQLQQRLPENFKWRKINVLLWNETTNVVQFWVEVKNYTDACGENPLKELSELALTTLSLPFSNAEVERVFSQMNLIKSKTRNRMGTELLTSLLQIRSGLKRHVLQFWQH